MSIERDRGRGWNAAVAAQLRAERAARGLTVDELADRAGIPRRTLMRLLNAQRALDVAHLAALASAVDLSVGELLARAEARLEDDEVPAAPPASEGDGRPPPADDETFVWGAWGVIEPSLIDPPGRAVLEVDPLAIQFGVDGLSSKG